MPEPDQPTPPPRRALTEILSGLPPLVRQLLLVGVVGCLVALNLASVMSAHQARDRSSVVETADVVYVPDTRVVRLMTLGYEQAAADLVWVRTLEYFARHFGTDRRYRWLEHFIEQVIELDPNFQKVYHWAGSSVLYGRRFTPENIELSNRFYLLAAEHAPDDYEAVYRLGLNHYIEMSSALLREPEPDRALIEQHREIGLSYLERAANTPGAPGRMRNLVAAISTRLGKEQLALQYLLDLFIQTDDPARKRDLEQRIAALRASRDASGLTAAAARFQEGWKSTFPYVPSSVYGLMGEPEDEHVTDRDWRSLLPDIAIEYTDEDEP